MNKENIKCQIKNLNNPDFKITFEINEEIDIETKALELLGYFVVIEAPETAQD